MFDAIIDGLKAAFLWCFNFIAELFIGFSSVVFDGISALVDLTPVAGHMDAAVTVMMPYASLVNFFIPLGLVKFCVISLLTVKTGKWIIKWALKLIPTVG